VDEHVSNALCLAEQELAILLYSPMVAHFCTNGGGGRMVSLAMFPNCGGRMRLMIEDARAPCYEGGLLVL
jgi:hypothetical protein